MTVVDPIRPTDAEPRAEQTDGTGPPPLPRHWRPLADALARLDPATQSLLDLSIRGGYSYPEIAAALNSDPATVAAWQADALNDIAVDVGTSRERTDELRARLDNLPPRAWPSTGTRTDDARPASVRDDLAETRLAETALAESRTGVSAPAVYALLLGAIAALTPLRDVWAVQAVVGALLLTVPGLLLLRALRVPGSAVAAFPVYVPCASLVVLLGAGLGIDLIGPEAGLMEPLRTAPLLAAVEGVCLLLLLAGARASAEVAVPWRALALRVSQVWPLALPLVSAAGAMLLNNGHGPTVAIAGALLVAAALVAGCLLAPRLSKSQLALLLYGMGLAAVWSFSLRSSFVYGFDIATEYHVLTSTWEEGIWRIAHPDDAYGAMLSLTVLPAVLHGIAGLSPLVLLKVVYPMLFALVPVGVFFLANRFVSRRMAFVAAAFILIQSYFFQQLPAIARQEIALLLFVGLIAAILDRSLPRKVQWPLVALLSLGIVVAHYSTTYLVVPVFGVALLLQPLIARVRPMPRLVGAMAVAFVVAAVGAGAWYSVLTQSSENVDKFTASFAERGLDVLPNAKEGQSFLDSYLSGNTGREITPEEYEQTATQDYDKRGYVHPLKAADDPKYDLRATSAPGSEVERMRVDNLMNLSQVAIGQIANLLAIAGALVLLFSRRTGALARSLGLIGLSTLVVLAFLRLSGTAAQAYNQERAFIQMMIPLSIGIAWILGRVAQRGRLLAAGVALLSALALGTFFLNAIGIRGVLSGGPTQTNLSDQGDDYERFYVAPQEIAAARWAVSIPRNQLVYTDRYGQLRYLAATGRTEALLLDITPRTLDRDAWVFASRTNTVGGRARGDAGTGYVTYEWPRRFLNDHFDTVYSNGSAEVLHR